MKCWVLRIKSSLPCYRKGKSTYEIGRNFHTVFYETTGGVGEKSKSALFSNKFGKLCMPYLLVEIHKAHKHTRGSESPVSC